MEKQFLVVKIAQQIGSAMSVIPMAGALPWFAAQEFIARLRKADPNSQYLIQEVGAA